MTEQIAPSDGLMMAYAAGVLPEAFDLVMATQVSMSDESRATLHAFEGVGGAVLETTGMVDMADDSLERTLARITGAPEAPAPRKAEVPGAILPAPLRERVGGDIDAVAWRTLGAGVKQAILPTESGATVRLLYIPSGRTMPDHGHGGTEMTLVLQGAYRDEFGEYHRGDLEVADETQEHTPVAFGPEDCICLAASDAPMRFKAILPRLLQPLFRI